MKKSVIAHDAAYICFLFWAVPVTVLGVFLALYGGSPQAAIIIVLIPFLLASFVTMLVGIVLSIFLWKHWPLIIIAVSSVLLARVYFKDIDSYTFQATVSLVYGIGVTAMSGLWFLFLRRRLFPPDVKE
jgi:hypothetical protein